MLKTEEEEKLEAEGNYKDGKWFLKGTKEIAYDRDLYEIKFTERLDIRMRIERTQECFKKY